MARTPRLPSVGDLLGQLQFVSSSAPALYLNEQLTNELFRSQLGAIDRFTRRAGRAVEGGVDAPLVKVGASTDRADEITYDLADPLTKALLLHSALGGEKAVAPPERAPRGAFVDVIAPAHLPDVITADPPPSARLLRAIKGELDRQLGVVRGLGDEDTVLLPLLLVDPESAVGSIIDRRWLRPGIVASYGSGEQVAFGLNERRVGGIQLITLIYLRPYL
jgi:hypothetical protein